MRRMSQCKKCVQLLIRDLEQEKGAIKRSALKYGAVRFRILLGRRAGLIFWPILGVQIRRVSHS